MEKGILNPVRSSNNSNTEYFLCQYCLGYYSKYLLRKHVKKCTNKPHNTNDPGKRCLSDSQTVMAGVTFKNQEFMQASRLRQEVFPIMRPDKISSIAKHDVLICLYGEFLINKHKRQQIATVISGKMRELARLWEAFTSINFECSGLFDSLRPEMFRYFVLAAKVVSGYNPETKCFKSPSLALHLGTTLKIVCEVAFRVVMENKELPKITWTDRNRKKQDIKDLEKLIKSHWCNELASLALKNLQKLPLAADIQTFKLYLDNCAERAYNALQLTGNDEQNYRTLTQCVLVQTVIFNRKRVGEVQYLRIDTYVNSDIVVSHQEVFVKCLTPVEKILSKKFKRVVTMGKGSKPVPMLFSKCTQKYIKCLIEIRKTSAVVPISNPYLFANPGSINRWMCGSNVIRKLALQSGANNPLLLTSTKFRKHIATTLQLLNMSESEMEQIAKFMGHTKKTHEEFYRYFSSLRLLSSNSVSV